MKSALSGLDRYMSWYAPKLMRVHENLKMNSEDAATYYSLQFNMRKAFFQIHGPFIGKYFKDFKSNSIPDHYSEAFVNAKDRVAVVGLQTESDTFWYTTCLLRHKPASTDADKEFLFTPVDFLNGVIDPSVPSFLFPEITIYHYLMNAFGQSISVNLA